MSFVHRKDNNLRNVLELHHQRMPSMNYISREREKALPCNDVIVVFLDIIDVIRRRSVVDGNIVQRRLLFESITCGVVLAKTTSVRLPVPLAVRLLVLLTHLFL